MTYRENVGYAAPAGAANSSTFIRNNLTLEAAAASGRYPELIRRIRRTYSQTRADWVAPDGVHLTVAGGACCSGVHLTQSLPCCTGGPARPESEALPPRVAGAPIPMQPDRAERRVSAGGELRLVGRCVAVTSSIRTSLPS